MAASIESAVDAQELAQEQKGLLELIDKLRFAQLDNVKLPQIVVVGDQSAGKSSVLEAITGTPFPREAGACTRFATEIRLRRSPETSLEVSIIPDRTRNVKEQERLRHFGGTVGSSMPFEALMRAAVDMIAPKNIPGRFAARDILVVEKCGPDMPLLTLVDLPGLVKNANNDQSLEDIKTIELLSDRYMKSSRTIILAVVGGNSDYVQAPILTKARQFDPSGSRTIGVLTKPDLTESIGLEDKFIDLVTNKDQRNLFQLGWFVLLNPGPREPGQPWPSAEQRRQNEDAFFRKERWNSLPESMRGASALRQKLSTQLQRHIGRHVKILRKQIQDALDACEAELKALGTGKDTPEEMRIELVELFSASKELVIPAVYGFYKNPPRKSFFRVTADPRGTPAQNLRARATEENERFATRVRAHGRKHDFRSSSDNRETPSTKHSYAGQEVEMLLRQIRGSEFPMDPKPRAVYMLFQNYSEYWPKLAQEHKDNLGVVCNEFLSELIDYAWPKRMREPLRRYFLDPQMRQLMDKAQSELDLLTQDMNLEVQPYDPEYEERLRKWQADASKDGATFSEAQEVLEKMLIYYELSAKSFIRNTICQVVERHLLQGMYSIFNSVEVLGMNNEIILAIAAENKETRERRQTLKTQRQAIQEAKDICANLAMRKELRAYAEDSRENPDDTSDEEGDARAKPNPRVARRSASPLSVNRQMSRRNAKESPAVTHDNSVYGTIMDTPSSHQTSTTNINTNKSRNSLTEAYAASNGDHDDDYDAMARAPANAPPPPPRPDKVRHEGQRHAQDHAPEQYYAHSGNGPSSNNPYVAAAATAAQPRSPAPAGLDANNYVQSAARKQHRSIFGRA